MNLVPVLHRLNQSNPLTSEDVLRNGLQVEGAEQWSVFDLLDRGRTARRGGEVAAGGLAAGAPLAPAVGAASGRRPGRCGTRRRLALVGAVTSAWVGSVLYGAGMTRFKG